jgi:hypothetical protein
MSSTPPISFGDHVLILRTEETEALGYGDQQGTCWGFTTPSITSVEVVGSDGSDGSDFAYNIHFEGELEDGWFAPQLVRFLDHAPGTEMKIGERGFVRRDDGEWDPR